MNKRAAEERLMRTLIRYMGSQTAAARAIGVSKQKFNYWLNSANQVPGEYLIIMEALIKNKLQCLDQNIEQALAIEHNSTQPLDITQQVTLALSQGGPIFKPTAFKDCFEFRLIHKVIQFGCEELIASMDTELLTIAQAVSLAELPKEMQRILLQTENKKLLAKYLISTTDLTSNNALVGKVNKYNKTPQRTNPITGFFDSLRRFFRR